MRLRERYRRQGKVFVHIDESGFDLSTQRQYAYARRGQKVIGYRNGQKRPRTNLLAARLHKRLIAPLLFPGTCNTTLFNLWLERELCPLLNQTIVVILDNATFHKSKQTKALIEATGARILFLPPYSPDLNPIEKTFANMKRKRSEQPHLSLDALTRLFC